MHPNWLKTHCIVALVLVGIGTFAFSFGGVWLMLELGNLGWAVGMAGCVFIGAGLAFLSDIAIYSERPPQR